MDWIKCIIKFLKDTIIYKIVLKNTHCCVILTTFTDTKYLENNFGRISHMYYIVSLIAVKFFRDLKKSCVAVSASYNKYIAYFFNHKYKKVGLEYFG